MKENPIPTMLDIKMAVIATQAGYAATDDCSVISVIYDDFGLLWPANHNGSEPLRNARSISLIAAPGTAIALDLRGAALPDCAKGLSAAVQVRHRDGGVESSVVTPNGAIDHALQTRFGASGRMTITVSAIIYPLPGGGPERQLHLDTLDITAAPV